MNKIAMNLWFDNNAEEAANFYASIFGGKVNKTTYYTEVGQEIHHQAPGSVMTVEFEVLGQQFVALNGGPVFTLNPSVSFMVNCKTADEVNELWAKLSNGSKRVLMPLDAYPFSEQYGWIEDKYGVSWQISVAPDAAQKLTPSLMFVGEKTGQAEQAIEFYASVFKNASIDGIYRYGADQAPDKEGTVMYADFTLEGQKFAAMDSAREHGFDFSEAISFIIDCKTQEEVDYYWEKLSAVPEAEQCGWLKDRYGVSWQVIPTVLNELLDDPDPEKVARVTAVMLQMKKLNIAELQGA